MEGFFYRCRAVCEESAGLREFIYRTYQGAANEILRLPWREAERIIIAGREQSQKNDFWLMYCSMYPFMNEDNFISFDDWYNGLKHEPQKSEKSISSIIADVNNIIGMTLTGGQQDGVTV